MDQRGKGITIILKLLARGETDYISKFKLLAPLLVILFSILSMYNPYINNMDILLFGTRNQGYYMLDSNGTTIFLCNVSPIIYLDRGGTLLGFNGERNCTKFLELTICFSGCYRKPVSYTTVLPSTVLINNFRSSIDGIIGLIKVLIVIILVLTVFMISYESTVTSNHLHQKLRHWKLNVASTYMIWSSISITVVFFVSMSIGVVVATVSSFISSLLFSTIYMKPILTFNDLLLIYLPLSLSSLIGTSIGVKGLEK